MPREVDIKSYRVTGSRRVQALTMRLALAFVLAWVIVPSPSLGFDDEQFCLAVREIIRSSTFDVGTWADRFTRNDGVELICDRKLVHFKKYYGAPSSAITDAWRDRKAEEWESGYCKRSLWSEAISSGWIISSTVATITGEQLWLACLPGGRAFHRVLPP
jgi:hypothetical protein